MKTQTNFKLEQELKDELKIMARLLETSRTKIVELAIREFWFNHMKLDVPTEKGE